MRSRCIFCGGRANSNEHVIPDWLAEFMVRPGRTITVRRGREGRHTPFEIEQPQQWETDLLVIKAKQVCKRCNETWMCNLEGAVQPWLKPMIRGLDTELSPEGQDIVTRWVFKTAVMLQYAQSPPHPADPARLQRIFTGAEPPRDDWVALAKYAYDDVAVWGLSRTLSAGRPGSLTKDVQAEMLTVCIGHLVVQTIVWTRGRDIRLLIPAAAYDFIVPIWPLSSLLRTWPPSASLDGRGLLDFCENFTSRSSFRIFVPDDTAV
jgi:hypothetical protein